MREKTVFDTSEIFHLFANGKTGSYRNRSGNVFAEGDALYSYGHHFAMLARVGGRVLVNSDKYSATTNKHASQAWCALPQAVRLDSLPVPGMKRATLSDLPGLAKECAAHACALLEKTEKARSTRPGRIREANRYLETARFLLTHAGDKKGAAKLPVLNGEESVETIAAVMRGILGAEYLKKAKSGQARAEGLFNGAVSIIERVRANGKEWNCDFNAADSRLRDAGTALHHAGLNFRQAGKAYPRACAKLEKEIEALRESIAPECAKEHAAETLQHIDLSIKDAMREFYAQTRKPGIIGSGWAISRVSEYARNLPAGYELEKTRPHVAAFLRRRNAVAATRFAAWKGAGLVREVQTFSGSDKNLETETARRSLGNATDKAPGFRNSPEYRAISAAIVAAEKHNAESAILRQRAAAEKIEAWKVGARVSIPYGAGTFARIEGDEVTTNLGARVPLSHAARLVRIARRVAKNGGQEWKHGEGPRVGYYSVTRIGPDLSAVIGCHNFSAEESARVCALIEETAAYTETAEG